MNDNSFKLITDRLDRIEDKVDALNEFKWSWIGRMGIITFIGSIVVSSFIAKVFK